MNVKSAFAFAALLGSICGAVYAGTPARAVEESAPYGALRAQALACAAGYHLDGNGDCQPNGGQANLQPCPPGQLAEPYPNGASYRCAPIPAGYSQYFR